MRGFAFVPPGREDIYQRNLRWRAASGERCERLRVQRQHAQTSECTFTPRISARRPEPVTLARAQQFFNDAIESKRKKDSRLQELRQVQARQSEEDLRAHRSHSAPREREERRPQRSFYDRNVEWLGKVRRSQEQKREQFHQQITKAPLRRASPPRRRDDELGEIESKLHNLRAFLRGSQLESCATTASHHGSEPRFEERARRDALDRRACEPEDRTCERRGERPDRESKDRLDTRREREIAPGTRHELQELQELKRAFYG